MKKIFYLLLLLPLTINAQTWTGNTIEFVHPTFGSNSDYTAIYRDDTQSDVTVLKVRMGDENSSNFQIGYNFYGDGQWYPTFSLDGSGNGYFKGNVGIGVPVAQEALHINGSVRGNISGALRISSGNGYIDVGAQNPSWAHIYTDRPNFIFNQSVYTTGIFSTYNNADLTLATGGTNRFSISGSTGNVGIGTINAPEKLTVTGNIQVPLSNAMGYLISTDKFTHNGNNVGNYSQGWFWDSWQTGAPTGYLSSAGGLKFFTGSNLRVAIDSWGNVGIGTGSATLDAKLDVKGMVHAQEVKVDLSVPGPDYVFEKDYKLTSLEEIKTYIDQNKHLPEVPSAKEMEKNGVLLGEMNMVLLKKIEELTLHLIETSNRVDRLEKENRELKNKIK